MDPQPFSQGNYELNEKCDNHDDWWCLFYWSLFICTGHLQGPWSGPSVWWLQCTHLGTHSSLKRSRTIGFFGEKKNKYFEGNIIKRHQTLEWRPWNRCCVASFSAANHLNQMKSKCWQFTFMNSTDVFKPTFIWFLYYVVTLLNFWSG